MLQQLGQLVAAMPKDVFLRGFAANALLAAKQPAIAVAQFREVLKLDPNNADALNSLAWIEATHADAKLRNGKEAVVFAEKAAGLKKDDAPTLDTLAAAYAEAGRFKEAVATAQKAKQLAEKAKLGELSKGIAEELKRYEAGKPLRDPSLAAKSPERPAATAAK